MQQRLDEGHPTDHRLGHLPAPAPRPRTPPPRPTRSAKPSRRSFEVLAPAVAHVVAGRAPRVVRVGVLGGAHPAHRLDRAEHVVGQGAHVPLRAGRRVAHRLLGDRRRRRVARWRRGRARAGGWHDSLLPGPCTRLDTWQRCPRGEPRAGTIRGLRVGHRSRLPLSKVESMLARRRVTVRRPRLPRWCWRARRARRPARDAATLDLHRGSRGSLVTLLETRLATVGLPPPAVDRRYRTATVHAVKQFQRRTGLRVTGRVSLRTWNAVSRRPRATHPRPPPRPSWLAPAVTAHRGGRARRREHARRDQARRRGGCRLRRVRPAHRPPTTRSC